MKQNNSFPSGSRQWCMGLVTSPFCQQTSRRTRHWGLCQDPLWHHITDEKLQEMIQISLKVNNMLLITDHFSLIWFLIASILFLTILQQIGGDICSLTIPSALACLSRLTVPVVMFPRWLSAMFSWQSQMLVWLRSSHLDTCNCCSEIWYQAWSFPCNPDDVIHLVLTSCTIWLQIRTVT